MKEYIIYGNGGYAKVVEDLIELVGGKIVAKYDVENVYKPHLFVNAEIVVAIGNTEVRSRIAKDIVHKFATLIHPNAYVSKRSVIGEGTVILANAAVHADAVVGKHVIINSNVIVDHDAIVGDYVTTYPGVFFGGMTVCEDFSRIEATVIR